MKPVIIFDFDSTFIMDETIDFMAKNLSHDVQLKIKEITDKAMNGMLDFRSALLLRTRKLKIHRNQIRDIAKRLERRISPSFQRNKKIINSMKKNIFIVSGGFKEIIIPIVNDFGILEKNIYANEFKFDNSGMVSGINEKLDMSYSNGKIRVLEHIDIKTGAYVVGDGMTDFEMTKSTKVKAFICYTENIKRSEVYNKSKYFASSLDKVFKIINEKEKNG